MRILVHEFASGGGLAGRRVPASLGRLASADAVWLVAPETDSCLERLAARVEETGRALLGSGAAAIRRASD